MFTNVLCLAKIKHESSGVPQKYKQNGPVAKLCKQQIGPRPGMGNLFSVTQGFVKYLVSYSAALELDMFDLPRYFVLQYRYIFFKLAIS